MESNALKAADRRLAPLSLKLTCPKAGWGECTKDANSFLFPLPSPPFVSFIFRIKTIATKGHSLENLPEEEFLANS